MPEILDIYPDACFIWRHRDPLKAIISSIDLAGNLIWARSDQVGLLGFEAYNQPERALPMIERPIEWLEAGVVPRERLCNVNYVDFIGNAVAVVARIYDYFGIDFTPAARAAMETHMREQPRSSRPAHSYDDAKLKAISRERAAFQRYQSYFNVPSNI